MSLTTYESGVKSVSASTEKIFTVLSNMNNLQVVKDKLPKDKIQDFTTTADTCSFKVNPLGSMSISVVSKEPFKTIKYGSKDAPMNMNFNVWIQIKEISKTQSAIKLTMKIDLNLFLKSMIGSFLSNNIDKAAVGIANLPYNKM